MLFLGILVGVGKAISFKISDFFVNGFGKETAAVILTAFCLIIAAIAESQFKLAMIVGAAATGMVVSGTRIGHILEDFLKRPEVLLAPVFFVVMGMLVDLQHVTNFETILMAIIMSIIAIIGKVVGCGYPAKLAGFSNPESLRIGIGMNNRGEVGLIVAGIGFALGVFDSRLLAVAIIVILVTTIPTPSLLKKLSQAAVQLREKMFKFENLTGALRSLYIENFMKAGYSHGFQAVDFSSSGIHELVNEDLNARISLTETENGLLIDSDRCEHILPTIMSETKEHIMEMIEEV